MSEFDSSYDDMKSRIFDLLNKRGMSQKELALKINVTPQTITDWKKGKSCSFASMLDKLSAALETTPSWIFLGQGIEYMPNEERQKREKEHFIAAHEYESLYLKKILADPKISEREKEFIELFMKLTPEQQDMFLAQLKGVVDSQGN